MAYEALLVFHYCPDLPGPSNTLLATHEPKRCATAPETTTVQVPQGRVDGMWLERNLRVGRQ